jgi:hypothetical protein
MRLIDLYFPTWISFPSVPLEYYKLACWAVGIIGPIVGNDRVNNAVNLFRFCVGVDVFQGWISAITG